MLRNAWLRRGLSVGLVAAFLPMATAGCFGDFRLLKKVYGWNKRVSHDKWVRWLVFLVINIVPVYGLATLIDALIANSLEFWTGQNPISASSGTTRTATGPGGETLAMTLREDGAIDARVSYPDGTLRSFRLVREADSIVAFDAQGHEIARVGDRLGEPALLASR